jgi:CheY-like chemotaxis protein
LTAEGVEMFFNELASGAPFDLVLTDYRMPEKNGGQVIAEILEAVPKQPIVLMTAYNLDPIQDRSDKKIPIIQKPLALEQFNAVFQRYSKPQV